MTMKPSELSKIIIKLNVTRAEFAEIVGRDERTVRRWLSGESPIPFWVAKIVKK